MKTARAAILPAVGVLLFATAPAEAQCPDGSPPPCAPRRASTTARPQTPPPAPELRRLTTSGRVGSARLSDDGRLIAYNQDGVLYVETLLGGSRPIELSRDPSRFARGMLWFPDALRLLTVGDSGMFVVPALGGNFERISARAGGGTGISISPDGRFVLASGVTPYAELVDIDRRTPRYIQWQSNDRWYGENFFSPDGRSVVMVTDDGASRYQLHVFSIATGVGQPLLRDSVPLRSPRWDASTSSVVYARVIPTGTQIWRQQVTPAGVAVGAPRLVVPILEGLPVFQLVENGQHLAFGRTELVQNYYLRNLGADTSSRKLTNDATPKTVAGRLSPDGRFAAYVHVDANGHNVSVSPVEPGPAKALTFFRGRSIRGIRWSPDGRNIVLCSIGEGGAVVEIVNAETRETIPIPARNLSSTCTVILTRDAVIYQLAGNRNFAVQPLDGGTTKGLIDVDSVGFVFQPVMHPDGARLAVSWNRQIENGMVMAGVWFLSLASGEQRRIADNATPIRFSPDGSILYLMPLPYRSGMLTRLRLGESVTADALPVPTKCYPLDVAPDGSKALCLETESTKRDIWLIRNFDPARPASAAERP